jgi:hypothetical protein
MIIISSARRHSKDAEYAINQKRACESWQGAQQVYYFGSYEEDLAMKNVLWVRSEHNEEAGEWPTIKAMSEFASNFPSDLVAIANADILITETFFEVEKKLKSLTIPASTSYRYTYDPERFDLASAVRDKNDRGMDIFVCSSDVWKMISKQIPDYLRIGHPTWDTWVCGFLCHHFGYGFREFTRYRCIFHPRHGGRITPHSNAIRSDEPYFTLAKRPSPLTEFIE